MGAKSRAKGARIEREIVKLHEELGVHAERYPLSGASRFRGQGHDIDLYAFGVDEAPLVAEVKGRKGGDGFRLLERWLGDYDLLFLRPDRDQPTVVVPWRVWVQILKELQEWQRAGRKRRLAATLEKLGLDEGGTDGKTQTQTPGAGAGLKAGASGEKALINGDASRAPRRVAGRQA
jgi:hypothetical protein